MSVNAVIGAIFENMRGLEVIFEPTHETFKRDIKNTGDSREVTVKQFLESFFPPSYIIKKTKIYNKEEESQEIDCVIIAPNHPVLLTPKREVVLAEGVLAAVEVKPDITSLTDKSEFKRGLDQIQSVKKLKRTLPVLFIEGNVPDEIQRIPCVIFSKNSRNPVEIVNYMINCVSNGYIQAHELPDLIVTLDKGIIFHSMYIEKTLFENWVNQTPGISKTGEKYIHLETSNEITLGMFILILLCFKEPVPLIADHIIKDYIKLGLPANAEYKISSLDPNANNG